MLQKRLFYAVSHSFPLDGGRILRAAVWRIARNADRPMRMAAQAGEAVAFAFAFIVLGLMRFFVRASFGGLWWAFIGWFLLNASRTSYAQTELLAELRDRRVGEMMERDCPTVGGKSSLQEFVDGYLLPTGGYDFFEEMLGARGIFPRLLGGIRLIRADEGRHLSHGMDYLRESSSRSTQTIFNWIAIA